MKNQVDNLRAETPITEIGEGFDQWYWCLDTTVDRRVGNAKANTKYDVWQVAFLPNCA